MNHTQNSNGFTLIELSIVLVIIGLIIGGVLVGQDLIASAQLRSQVGQIEKYDTAVNTFKLKYNYLPGDMPPTEAAAFGLFALTGANAGTSGYGDGNKQVTRGAPGFNGEIYVFWRHLSEAGLIGGSYGADPNNPIDPLTGAPTSYPADISLFIPAGKIRNNVIQAFGVPTTASGVFMYRIYCLYTQTSETAISYNSGTGFCLSPFESYQIDVKIDDGIPKTGRVYTPANVGGSAMAPTSGKCLTGGSTSATDPATQYNLTYGSEQSNCAILIKNPL